jgi:fatty acid desaturase
VAKATPGKVRGLGRDVRDVGAVSGRVIAYNFGYLGLAWAVVCAAIAAFWLHATWYTFVAAFFIVSSRQQALLNCEHESIHHKFMPNRRWNEFVGRYFCAGPVGSPFSASQVRHLAHHRLLGTDQDPDRLLHSGPDKRSAWGLAKHFLNGLIGGYAGMVLMGPRVPNNVRVKGSVRRDFTSIVLAQAVLFGGLTLLCSWWVFPLLWALPLGTVTVMFHLIRSFVEHAITDSETVEHENRLITISSNWLERAIVAPYFMNYHAEHHLAPSVPAMRLRELQRHLDKRSDTPPMLVRASYMGALSRYVRSLKAS